MASPKRRADFPCYVLVPQCPPNEMWSVLSRTRGVAAPFGDAAEDSMRSVESAILHLLETENIDVSRMYVCGLSMGGFGTWDLIWRRPEWFAAAGPICGGANPNMPPNTSVVPSGIGMVMQTRPWPWNCRIKFFPPFATGDGHLKEPVCQGLDTTLGIRPTPTANSWTGCLPTGLIHWTQDGGRSDLEVGPCSIAC